MLHVDRAAAAGPRREQDDRPQEGPRRLDQSLGGEARGGLESRWRRPRVQAAGARLRPASSPGAAGTDGPPCRAGRLSGPAGPVGVCGSDRGGYDGPGFKLEGTHSATWKDVCMWPHGLLSTIQGTWHMQGALATPRA